jgi:hypothetical protein
MPLDPIRFMVDGSDDLALAKIEYERTLAKTWRAEPRLYDTSLPIVKRRAMTEGKSVKFRFFGDTDAAEDYNPGDELVGQAFTVADVEITIDKPIVAHKVLRYDDIAVADFDIFSDIGMEHARQISLTYDRRMFALAAVAARTAARTKDGLSVHAGGNRVTRSGTTINGAYARSPVGAAAFRADMRQLALAMDLDNVPPESRYLFIRPEIKDVLLFDSGFVWGTPSNVQAAPGSTLFSKDYQTANDLNSRVIAELDGFKIVGLPTSVSQGGSMPDTNVTTGLTKYQANFTAQASNGIPVAIALVGGPRGEAAVAELRYSGIVSDIEYRKNTHTWLVQSMAFNGMGVYAPWCAGSIEVTT